jgi:hypothetical protein
MANKREWIIGLACLAMGVLGGWLAAQNRAIPIAPAVPATAPIDSVSKFFSGFDPLPLAEAVSARSRSKNEIAMASSSVSGGGLRWGERWFTAVWLNRGELRDDLAASLELRLDEALAAANLTCANPVSGRWEMSGKLGSVYATTRSYTGLKDSGRLRAWLAMGESDGPVTLLITINEP